MWDPLGAPDYPLHVRRVVQDTGRDAIPLRCCFADGLRGHASFINFPPAFSRTQFDIQR